MGLYNITYKNKETEKEINAEMGKPFGLIEKLKLGGIGSRRMIIENFSEDIKNLTLKVSGIQYANIELRPNGIIVHINQESIHMPGRYLILGYLFLMAIFSPFMEEEVTFNLTKKKAGKKTKSFYKK
ncbi:MAG: hypothetical protein CM15mP65_22550 [Crocinitomicaceae bacterium]|nr:MAG: hypothetical protein CM15mP65_22550 [Crocinitomicaceae bacterium]